MAGRRKEGADNQVLTIRMPRDEHESLKSLAFLSNTSINDIVLRAVREFMSAAGRTEHVERLLERARTQYRVALDKLADM